MAGAILLGKKRHRMGVEACHYSPLTSAPNDGGRSTPRHAPPRPIYRREWHGTPCTGMWVNPRADLDGCGNISSPPEFDQLTVCLSRSEFLYRLSYPSPSDVIFLYKISTYKVWDSHIAQCSEWQCVILNKGINASKKHAASIFKVREKAQSAYTLTSI